MSNNLKVYLLLLTHLTTHTEVGDRDSGPLIGALSHNFLFMEYLLELPQIFLMSF